MIRSAHGPRPDPRRRGFTLVEILVVIIIVAILVGLLLPVIAGAVRTAKNAAVSSEINLLAQALESFKARYGQYPPSRVLLVESGNYTFYMTNNNPIQQGDITYAQLAQRTISAFRKMFPKVVLSTSGNVPTIGATNWYDFNGNGAFDSTSGYILQGHECLVFFLGGIPLSDPTSSTFGLTGFGTDPTNPFTNNIASDPRYNGAQNPMCSTSRQPSFFEFNAGRLFLDPYNTSMGGASPGIPAYYDSLGNTTPAVGATALNFYAYFNAYGNGLYDPNDVNFTFETDAYLATPIGLKMFDSYTPQSNPPSQYTISPAPNPYTTTLTVTTTGTITYQKPQTFQILSAGVDGLYGVGGQFLSSTTPGSGSTTNPLPFDANDTYAGSSVTQDLSIRNRERDNLTNFKTSTLD